MKRQRPLAREAAIDTLVRGLQEICRQAGSLVRRAQIGGDVICTINLPLRLRFMVPTATDRDAIVQAVGQAMAGRLTSRVLWRWFR
jgi:hypothetical protein